MKHKVISSEIQFFVYRYLLTTLAFNNRYISPILSTVIPADHSTILLVQVSRIVAKESYSLYTVF